MARFLHAVATNVNSGLAEGHVNCAILKQLPEQEYKRARDVTKIIGQLAQQLQRSIGKEEVAWP